MLRRFLAEVSILNIYGISNLTFDIPSWKLDLNTYMYQEQCFLSNTNISISNIYCILTYISISLVLKILSVYLHILFIAFIFQTSHHGAESDPVQPSGMPDHGERPAALL